MHSIALKLSINFSNPNVFIILPALDVCDFLRQIGLSEYVKVFTTEKIDGLMLEHLDEDIMTSDLSMRRIDARRLVTKMKQLK